MALDSTQVREIARRLEPPESTGSVDELGLGVITEEIAESLFPAFTTLMTRARYFIFLRGVMECAAWQAWQRVKRAPTKGEMSLENSIFVRQFVRTADEEFRAVETALAEALVRANPEELGIIGSGIVRTTFRSAGAGTRIRRLFSPIERYPSALYFTGARKLGAFASGIHYREDIWQGYLARFLDDDCEIWDTDWALGSAKVSSLITRLYRERFQKKSATTAKRDREATLELRPEEARLLRRRLTASSNGKISGAVAGVFLGLKDGAADWNADYYRRAARACADKKARRGLMGAAYAMEATDPVLRIYYGLRRRVAPGIKDKRAADKIAGAIWRQISRIEIESARRACGVLRSSYSFGIEATQALMWLSAWLDRAVKSRSVSDGVVHIRAVVVRERLVLRRPGRNKSPRFTPQLVLTARGKADWAKSRPADDDEDSNLESRASAGRLTPALRIFSDLRAALRRRK